MKRLQLGLGCFEHNLIIRGPPQQTLLVFHLPFDRGDLVSDTAGQFGHVKITVRAGGGSGVILRGAV